MVIDVKFFEVANIIESESLKDDKWFKIQNSEWWQIKWNPNPKRW